MTPAWHGLRFLCQGTGRFGRFHCWSVFPNIRMRGHLDGNAPCTPLTVARNRPQVKGFWGEVDTMRTMGSSGPARTFRFRVTGLKTDGLAADSVCGVAFASMNRLGCLKEPGNCLQQKNDPKVAWLPQVFTVRTGCGWGSNQCQQSISQQSCPLRHTTFQPIMYRSSRWGLKDLVCMTQLTWSSGVLNPGRDACLAPGLVFKPSPTAMHIVHKPHLGNRQPHGMNGGLVPVVTASHHHVFPQISSADF